MTNFSATILYYVFAVNLFLMRKVNAILKNEMQTYHNLRLVKTVEILIAQLDSIQSVLVD